MRDVIQVILSSLIGAGIVSFLVLYTEAVKDPEPLPPSPEVEYNRVIAECEEAIHIATEDKQECQERLYEVSDRLNNCDDLLRRVFGIPPKQ